MLPVKIGIEEDEGDEEEVDVEEKEEEVTSPEERGVWAGDEGREDRSFEREVRGEGLGEGEEEREERGEWRGDSSKFVMVTLLVGEEDGRGGAGVEEREGLEYTALYQLRKSF